MKIYHKLLPIVLLILLSSSGYSQIDSLEKLLKTNIHDTIRLQILTELNWEYLQSDLNKAEQYAKDEFELASSIHHPRFIAQAYNDFGIVCIKRSEFKKGLN